MWVRASQGSGKGFGRDRCERHYRERFSITIKFRRATARSPNAKGGRTRDRGRARQVRFRSMEIRWRRRRDSNPRYRIYQYDGLANRWFQPLTHVSAWSAALTAVWPRRVAIAMRFAPRNAKDCAFFVPPRRFHRANDSTRRKFDSGHRPFIARAP